MDRRVGRHATDQTFGREHVSNCPCLYLDEILTQHSSFMQSVSIIGYTLFPLVIASILSAVGLPTIVRIPVYIVLALWSLAAGVSILGGSGVVKNRVGLAVFPLILFYTGIACLCFIS